MITRFLDEETGIIYVSAKGLWTRQDVDDHYSKLRTMIACRRLEDKPVRILSNVTQAPRQTSEIETHIKWKMDQSFRPGDRVAVLIENNFLKTQLRSVIGETSIGLFCSPLAAEMWLLADQDDADVA